MQLIHVASAYDFYLNDFNRYQMTETFKKCGVYSIRIEKTGTKFDPRPENIFLKSRTQLGLRVLDSRTGFQTVILKQGFWILLSLIVFLKLSNLLDQRSTNLKPCSWRKKSCLLKIYNWTKQKNNKKSFGTCNWSQGDSDFVAWLKRVSASPTQNPPLASWLFAKFLLL